MAAALSQLALGAWLLVSAFLWPHSDGQFMLAALGGTLVLWFGGRAVATGRTDTRSRLVAFWVLLGAVLLPAETPASVPNHLIVGFGLLAFFHVGREPRRQR